VKEGLSSVGVLVSVRVEDITEALPGTHLTGEGFRPQKEDLHGGQPPISPIKQTRQTGRPIRCNPFAYPPPSPTESSPDCKNFATCDLIDAQQQKGAQIAASQPSHIKENRQERPAK
jgi:hypothetical protein